MACLIENDHHFTVSIPSYEDKDGVTHYQINVVVGTVSWVVFHRYKDFVELHETLVTDHCLSKEMLPRKKYIGNRDPQFIEKRKSCLENYLQTVIAFLQKAMPFVLLKFLDFDKYDISCILQNMAFNLKRENTFVESVEGPIEYTFSPLQLHAISERLQKCCFPNESYNNDFDFSHILEFCYNSKTVIIRGNRSNVGSSNLICNNLTFELTFFKTAVNLYFYNVQLSNIYDLGSLRQSVTSFVVYNSNMEQFSDALLCDKVHKTHEESEEHVWNKLMNIDFSWNEFKRIDKSISLSPNLRSLTMDGNQMKTIDNTHLIPNLTHLSICANDITIKECLASKLACVSHLNLSQNKIDTLLPFAKLVSLQELNLASNKICDSKEIKYISDLPKLNYLVLTGNPVSTIIDYRIKVFEYFNVRASYLCLDNERPSQKELDTAAVLRALTVVREGKTPILSQTTA